MYAEIPIITSNVSSMPEVAADAALLVDPLNIAEIASAMKQITSNEGLRETLISRGRSQRKKFSWDLTATRFWASVEKCLASADLQKDQIAANPSIG